MLWIKLIIKYCVSRWITYILQNDARSIQHQSFFLYSLLRFMVFLSFVLSVITLLIFFLDFFPYFLLFLSFFLDLHYTALVVAEGTKNVQVNLFLTKKERFIFIISLLFRVLALFISSLFSIVSFLCFLLAAFLSLCNFSSYIFSVSLISLWSLSFVLYPFGLDPRFFLVFS